MAASFPYLGGFDQLPFIFKFQGHRLSERLIGKRRNIRGPLGPQIITQQDDRAQAFTSRLGDCRGGRLKKATSIPQQVVQRGLGEKTSHVAVGHVEEDGHYRRCVVDGHGADDVPVRLLRHPSRQREEENDTVAGACCVVMS